MWRAFKCVVLPSLGLSCKRVRYVQMQLISWLSFASEYGMGASSMQEFCRICVPHLRESDYWFSKPDCTGSTCKMMEMRVSNVETCLSSHCFILKATSSALTLDCSTFNQLYGTLEFGPSLDLWGSSNGWTRNSWCQRYWSEEPYTIV